MAGSRVSRASPCVGGLVGLCVSGLWLAAFERNAAAVDMRMAAASRTEPDGWELLTGRPHSFDQGQAVTFDGEDRPRRVKVSAGCRSGVPDAC